MHGYAGGDHGGRPADARQSRDPYREPVPLFGFRLRPLPEIIRGWRDIDLDVPEYLSGWFWLTDGWYWIVTPDGDVPLEHPDFSAAFDLPDHDPHLDYQVARLWMDVQDMLPDVLEPVPADLGERLASGEWVAWRAGVADWFGALPDNDERGDWDVWHAATAWAGARTLDMGYLVAPLIRLWRVGESIAVTWDTRGKRVKGALCWVETQGHTTLSATQFQAEVEDFRARLDTAMRERVQDVAALGVLDAGALASLEHQHQLTLSTATAEPVNTDWAEVRAAIRQLEAWSGIPFA